MQKISKLYNIPRTENFLLVFAKHLMTVGIDYEDVIILPTRRAARKLSKFLLQHSVQKSIILPNIITYSDIVLRPQIFLNLCEGLDVSMPKQITAVDLRTIIWELLKKLNINTGQVDEIIYALNKYYTFEDSSDAATGTFIHPILLGIEKELAKRNLVLEPKARKIIAERIIQTFYTKKAKLHMVVPVESLPYNRRLIFGLVEQENVSLYIHANSGLDISEESHPDYEMARFLRQITMKPTELGGRLKDRLVDLLMCQTGEIEKWREAKLENQNLHFFEFENECVEARVISYIIREHVHLGYDSIAVVSDNFSFNTILKEHLKDWEITPNDTNEYFENRAAISEFALKVFELIKNDSLLNWLVVLKDSNSRFANLNWFEIENDYFRKVGANIADIPMFSELHQKIEWLKKFKGTFNEYLKMFEDFFKLITDAHHDLQALDSLLQISFSEFVELYSSMLAAEKGRLDEYGSDVVTITSLLETRLLKFDLVIIPQANHPFPNVINSNLLAQIQSIPNNSVNLGYLNSDIASLLHSKAFITRAQKVNGKAQNPSILFERGTALLGYSSEKEKYLAWYRSINSVDLVDPIKRPVPFVTKGKPSYISVSGLERLMENPYGFYAKYILGLKKLNEIAEEVSAKDFGTAIHETIGGIYYKVGMGKVEYLRLFEQGFLSEIKAFLALEEVENFWVQRSKRIAEWLWNYEFSQEAFIGRIVKESRIQFDVSDVRVLSIPDRVEYLIDGSVKVIDFKTGNVPSVSDVEKGLYPQLPLEALIISSANRPSQYELEYHSLKGKKEVAEIKKIKVDLEDVYIGLKIVIEKFFKNPEPFFAACDESSLKKTSDYIHLMRIREWFE